MFADSLVQPSEICKSTHFQPIQNQAPHLEKDFLKIYRLQDTQLNSSRESVRPHDNCGISCWTKLFVQTNFKHGRSSGSVEISSL